MTTPDKPTQLIVNKLVTRFPVSGGAPLVCFLDEVLSWNSSLGLVSRRDSLAACERLLMESLEWDRRLGPAAGLRVADVGSGAGFPGIVWAIQHPDWTFVLIERRERRAAFLERMVRVLHLPHVEVRAEDASEHGDASWRESFDLVVTMAVGDPAQSAARLEWMLRAGGRFSTTISRDRDAPATIGRALQRIDLHPGEFGRYATYQAGV